MARPCVKLSSENKIDELLEALNHSLPIFKEMEGIQGIVLDGGLSRGYGDELSEIDILIFLKKDFYKKYQQGGCSFAFGITVIDGALYDIKIVDYEEELAKEYDQIGLWDLSYATILYDPEGKMAELMELKLSEPVHTWEGHGFLWEAYWNYKLAGNIWIHRQDAMQGHMIFNNTIKPLLGALFIVNDEYVPHDKWLIHMSRTLEWLPDSYEELLQGAMNTGDFSVQSLKERQACIDKLWCAINKRLCDRENYHGNLDIVQRGSYQTLMKLLSKDEYTLAEWQEEHSLGDLCCEPIHSIFHRNGDRILLDKERFLSLKPEEMYIWMYEIVKEARETVQEWREK